MTLTLKEIAKILDWYEEYCDTDNPNCISAEQYIKNKLSWEYPEDKTLDKMAKDCSESLYGSDNEYQPDREDVEYGFKMGYKKAKEIYERL